MEELIVKADIMTPPDYIGTIMELCQEKRGVYINMKYIEENRAVLEYHLPLNEITQLQIKSLINKLDDMGYQWETQNKTRVILTDLFERALEDDFVRKNPARGVRLAQMRDLFYLLRNKRSFLSALLEPFTTICLL